MNMCIHKYFSCLLLLLSWLPTLLPAQNIERMAVAVYEAEIQKTADGKMSLYDGITRKVIISGADSIVKKKNLPFYIVKAGKRGVYSGSGSVLIPIAYDRIESLSPFFTLVEKGNLKGIYNNKGQKVLDTLYDELRNEGYNWSDKPHFHAKKAGKWGIYKDGKWVVNPIYDEQKGRGYLIQLVVNNRTDYLINHEHLITDVTTVREAFRVNGKDSHHTTSYYIFQKEGLYGLLNGDGKTMLPAQYEYLFNQNGIFNEEKAAWLIAKKNGKTGLIDIYGCCILPFEYEDMNTTWLVGYITVRNEDGMRFFHVDRRTFINDYSFDNYRVASKYTTIYQQGKTTLIDNETMKMVFPFKYEDMIPDDKTGYFTARQAGFYGMVDRHDKVIIPFMYEEPLQMYLADKIVVRKNGKYGIINLENKLLYGMTSHPIFTYSTYFEIYGTDKGNIRLDADLKPLE